MPRPKKIHLAFAGFIILAAAGASLFLLSRSKSADSYSSLGSLIFGGAEENALNEIKEEKNQEDSSEEAYTDTDFGFSFRYAPDMNVRVVEEVEGRKALLIAGVGAKQEIQIVITPFDEDQPITKERISQDIPDMIIEEPQEAIVGKEKFHILLFWSRDPSLGRTRELWFARAGNLYQISTYPELDGFLGNMMETWGWL